MATDHMRDLLQAISPEGSMGALASPAPWRQLSEQFDRLLIELASPVLGPGRALVALGAYGRSELTRGAELELLVLQPATAEDVVRTVISPLWDEHIPTIHTVLVPNQLSDRATTPS